VLPDGREGAIALDDRYRESTESCASLLRDLKRRDMEIPNRISIFAAEEILIHNIRKYLPPNLISTHSN